jgi:hypothetical protein
VYLRSIVRGPAFDAVTARLGISVRTLDDLVAPVEAAIAADPEQFPTVPGTDYRAAPVRMPNGVRLSLRYQTGVRYQTGQTCVVLDHVVVPHRVPAG